MTSASPTDRETAKIQLYADWTQAKQLMERLEQHFARLDEVHAVSFEAAAKIRRERDSLRAEVEEAERRVRECRQVIQRYAAVNEPVIATDGYTYEKDTMENYLEQCRRAGIAPVSQQTGEALEPALLYKNHSLRRFLDFLNKAIDKPAGVSAPSSFVKTSTPMQRALAAQAFIPLNAQIGMFAPTGTYNEPIVQLPTTFGGHYWGEGFYPTAATLQSLQPFAGKHHPCVRVYGQCNYGDSCVFAKYPAMTCLTYLKGKCRFGDKCHELHPRN